MEEDNRPSFFKIVFAGASNERLRIPSDFLKHISNESSDGATLTVCSGRSWNAKVSKKSHGVFIEDGWPEFLKDNSLGNNEFLVLTYEGNMCFGIQIFEVNGLERRNVPLMRTNQVPFDSTSSAEKPESRPRKHRACTTSSRPLASTSNIAKRPESRPRKHRACTTSSQPLASTSNIAKRPESRPRKHRACTTSSQPLASTSNIAKRPESRPRKHKVCTTSSQPLASTSNIAKRPESRPRKRKACTTSQPFASTRIAKRLQSRPRKHHTCPVNLHPSPKSCEEDGSGNNIACSESNKSHPKFKATKGKKMKIELEDEDQAVRFLSKDDMSRDQKAAQSFKTKFPHFKHPVRKYYVHVPKFFSKAHLRREKHEIVLRNLQGKSWVVTVVPTQNAHTLYGGWSAFVVDNKLNHNDVCIFELVDTQEMKVHIFKNVGPI